MTWVEEGIFAAGGDHIPHTWPEFTQQTGIQAVVHLAQARPARFEGRLARYLWLNVEREAEADIPTRELAAEFVRSCRESGLAVLLHCGSGRHRTRWIYVAYRLHTGASLRGVLRAAAEKPWMGPYHTDSGLWEAFCAHLQTQAKEPTPNDP
jgi:hypothetical protein